MKIALAAMDKNASIGYNNKLLFKIPEDQKFFKTITTGYPVVMGRKTFESLHYRILPNRYNIVITSDADYLKNNPVISSSMNLKIMTIEEIKSNLDYLEHNFGKIFIIGGQQVYTELLSKCDTLYLTEYDRVYIPADSYFPKEIVEKYFTFDKCIESGFMDLHRWYINKYISTLC